ncbi:MAG: chemotaxis protein CheX [Lachnospiraceae bacterium]|nr:chemotaxis protein CheX [Lachnospiraceae bacterium]MBQ6026366.1 chemotaxis protein CheX [Lachnospiraceae bacterium]MBR3483523.1 chemotaxis protein CheX [Lachnospiraceae bacterium]MBR3581159.1 chemotaxis protein CheX [Lachnospiraceae bacterium]MBR4541116.1 chemotaxis protein CheX [Lachnospiraceae bacterium]
MASVDIKYINPFVKATLTVMEMLGMTGGALGKPSLSDMKFPDNAFLIQVGVTGGMKGQVILGFTEQKAKDTASVMMMGMPVNELDAMACSALGELGNMIMGNSSTIFSTMNIVFDITPPLSMHGYDLKLQAETTAIRIPIVINDEEHLSIYICITDN